MPRAKREWRGDQLQCRGHDEWHHHSRFRRRRRLTPHGDVWDYDPDCRLWQQTQRVSTKHEDEALRIVEGRARKIVTKANKVSGEPRINTSKGPMVYEDWLDLEEDKRLSAQRHNDSLEADSHMPTCGDWQEVRLFE